METFHDVPVVNWKRCTFQAGSPSHPAFPWRSEPRFLIVLCRLVLRTASRRRVSQEPTIVFLVQLMSCSGPGTGDMENLAGETDYGNERSTEAPSRALPPAAHIHIFRHTPSACLLPSPHPGARRAALGSGSPCQGGRGGLTSRSCRVGATPCCL